MLQGWADSQLWLQTPARELQEVTRMPPPDTAVEAVQLGAHFRFCESEEVE